MKSMVKQIFVRCFIMCLVAFMSFSVAVKTTLAQTSTDAAQASKVKIDFEKYTLPKGLQVILHIDTSRSTTLCDRLVEIKELPFHPKEKGVDPTYDAFVENGDAALPCLIQRVSDTASMRDPRSSPKYPDIDNKVGDVAYFVFLDITGTDIVEFLPPDVKTSFKDEGVYSYFQHVKTKENRIKLQARLYEWYRQKYGREAMSSTIK